MEPSISGNAILKKSQNVMFTLFFLARAITTMLAADPARLPFPPRQDPSESAHHIPLFAILACSFIDSMMGIIMVVNGMLLTKAVEIPENQRVPNVANKRLPLVYFISRFEK